MARERGTITEKENKTGWRPGKFSAAETFPEIAEQLRFLEELMRSFYGMLIGTTLGHDDPQVAQQQGIVWMYSLKALKTKYRRRAGKAAVRLALSTSSKS